MSCRMAAACVTCEAVLLLSGTVFHPRSEERLVGTTNFHHNSFNKIKQKVEMHQIFTQRTFALTCT